jgi:hypothetical protein
MLEQQPDTYNLDKFPTIGICACCGALIKYSPIRMPKGRPRVSVDKAFHSHIEYVTMCIVCVKKELHTLQLKIDAGEMYPIETWTLDEDGPRIVTISRLLPAETAEAEVVSKPDEPEPVGLARRAWRLIVRILKFFY